MRILLVEDDASLHQRLQTALRQAGFAVDVAENGFEAECLGDTDLYDGVVLDLGLPDRPGLEVLQDWRRQGNRVPVLILTARDAWHERVDGLRAGADDYLGKPFYVKELLARLQALIRRSKGRAEGTLRVGGSTLDEVRQTFLPPDGPPVPLTGIEFRLLRYFMLHPGQVLSQRLVMVWILLRSGESTIPWRHSLTRETSHGDSTRHTADGCPAFPLQMGDRCAVFCPRYQ